jgi:putative ABC transport system ATP-binding protein
MIEVIDLCKTYARSDGVAVDALKYVSFAVPRGEFVVVRGASGSGKSSLLNILGCLDKPSKGTYRLDGQDVSGYSDKQLSNLRCHKIGFVFQSFNLLPRTTALENVEVPMIYGGRRVDSTKALKALDRVGLAPRARHYATELSGGEQQRVAIARALINDPHLILADEPTGNMDSSSGTDVLRILEGLVEEGRTVVLVTHDDAVASRGMREIVLADGELQSDQSLERQGRR